MTPLTALVLDEMLHDWLNGDLFLFVGRTRTRAKVLYFDGTGMCLFAKRLDRGRFAAPWDGQAEITESELQMLLEGAELVGRMPLSPKTRRLFRTISGVSVDAKDVEIRARIVKRSHRWN
jgi:transposase